MIDRRVDMGSFGTITRHEYWERLSIVPFLGNDKTPVSSVILSNLVMTHPCSDSHTRSAVMNSDIDNECSYGVMTFSPFLIRHYQL
jgi:hypothetical protein